MAPKRYRVTQRSRNYGTEYSKDYRSKLWARLSALLHRGSSPAGVDFYTTTIEEI